MQSSENPNRLKVDLTGLYEKIFTDLNNIHNPNFLNLDTTASVELKKIFVPLTSNFHIDIDVRNGKTETLIIYRNTEEIARYNGQVLLTKKKNLNEEFAEILFGQLQDFIMDKIPYIPGIRLNHRPLVAEPIWSDGLKKVFARIDIPSSLNIFNKVVLLGPPGSGKSTTAKFLACSHLTNFVGQTAGVTISDLGIWGSKPLLAIFTEVRQFVSAEQFRDINSPIGYNEYLQYLKNEVLRETPSMYEYVISCLTSGSGILIFDGLDEITIPDNVPDALPKRRGQMIRLMESLSRQFSQCKIIITSRPAGYSEWTIPDFEVIRILPVDETETKSIIKALYSSIGTKDEEVERKTMFLTKHLQRVPKNLREQPLFIVLLAKLYNENKDQQLPVNRGALLEHSIKLLLSSWFTNKSHDKNLNDLLGVSEEQLLCLLQAVAKRSLESEVLANTTEEQQIPRAIILDELFDIKDSNYTEILNYISHHAGILISPSIKTFRFAHRLFQEYLAASHLATSNFISFIPEALEKSFQTWKEVTLLLADILSRSNEIGQWELVEKLSSSENNSIIWLSGLIIIEQNMVIPTRKSITMLAGEIRNNLSAAIEKNDLPLSHRVSLLIALDYLIDPRPGVGLNREGLPDIQWCRIESSRYMLGLTAAQADKLTFSGTAEWQFSRELPAFEYSNEPFEISLYPVTIRQFSAFVNAPDGYIDDRWWTTQGLSWREKNSPPMPGELSGNCPQNYVNWFEACAFCKWLGAKTLSVIRLPTEPEWEVAAKNNHQGIYPWGDDYIESMCNIRNTGFNNVIPVGAFSLTNRYKPADMIGNVWEWCSTIVEIIAGDKYIYPYTRNDGRENPEGGDDIMRATRGGYYGSSPFLARSSYRGRDIPSSKLARQGFRIVREV